MEFNLFYQIYKTCTVGLGGLRQISQGLLSPVASIKKERFFLFSARLFVTLARKKHIMMKVLLINGSPKENGNTFLALSEVAKALNAEDISTEIISIGKGAIQGCIACGMCGRIGKCTFNDDLYYKIWRTVNDGIDGLVIGSPVYYGGPNGSLCALLDRVFYSLGRKLQYKPGACVVTCRRGGASAAFDRLNKYLPS